MRRATMPEARIYDCTIRHVRRGPVHNDFTYRTSLWLVDLDHIPRLPGPLNRLTEFRASDHAGDPKLGLRQNVESYLAGEGIDLAGGRVLMLTAPRSLGHVFNPLTVYWCHDAAGTLACVIAEVHNTYGGRHRYLLRPDDAGRADADKQFYVSPFYPVSGQYRMSVPEPGEDLHLTIRYQPPDAAPFVAVLRGRATPASLGAVVRRALTQPCPTLLTAARIRVQGVRLYLRGLPVTPRSAQPSTQPCPRSSDHTIASERTARSMSRPTADPVAPRLDRLYRDLTGGRRLPVGIRAWDGSHAGPVADPTLVIRSPRALRRLLWAPNELGLAQAYVTGELDLNGDVAEGLRRVWDDVGRSDSPPRMTKPANLVRLLSTALRFGAVGPRPAPPASQARVNGDLHTLARDRAVIAHHYDLSNDFYALLLDPTMAYSSAYWTSTEPGYTLADAQRDKLDLICRKLELAPGMRLLDIGCGWGGLLIHAVERFGVHGLGLTLSEQQAAYINDQLKKRGLADQVEVRVAHFREFHEPHAFDAVASIEMGEHVGAEAYPVYTSAVRTALKAGGRALIQQMSRAHGTAPGGGPFIEAFIAPDMQMRPIEETIALWRAAGFQVHGTESLREHYVRTVAAWRENLEDSWVKARDLVGDETARVWRLYLGGGQLAFEQGRMGVDQILLGMPTEGSGDDGH
ncbi:DUF1365 family protein [Actinospica robiniae]|uniref:DUF1365 family protein n=1 Tax=Actinospica robiniae TaxID=304901 RepID=UPI001B7FCAAF|nr:DUF1365 family protein [Actinospica robiniae]